MATTLLVASASHW